MLLVIKIIITRGNFRKKIMAHLRRKCVELRQKSIKLIVFPVTTRAFAILINTNNDESFDE